MEDAILMRRHDIYGLHLPDFQMLMISFMRRKMREFHLFYTSPRDAWIRYRALRENFSDAAWLRRFSAHLKCFIFASRTTLHARFCWRNLLPFLVK